MIRALFVFFDLDLPPKEREKQLQISKAMTLTGMGIFQREAPNQFGVSLFLPQAQQVSYIASLLSSHEDSLYFQHERYAIKSTVGESLRRRRCSSNAAGATGKRIRRKSQGNCR